MSSTKNPSFAHLLSELFSADLAIGSIWSRCRDWDGLI